MMKKKLMKIVSLAALASMCTAATAGAVEVKTYSEDLKVYYNNEDVYANDTNKPCIINDRTMVRAVPIFEKMGFTIPSYNGATKTATISNAAGDASYTFTNDSTKAIKTVNGASSEIELDVPATLYNDTFYVPLRKFCDMCGLSISWENDARSVYVNSAATETSNTAPGTAVTPEPAAAAATPAPTEATTAPASGDSAIDFSQWLGTWYYTGYTDYDGMDPADIQQLEINAVSATEADMVWIKNEGTKWWNEGTSRLTFTSPTTAEYYGTNSRGIKCKYVFIFSNKYKESFTYEIRNADTNTVIAQPSDGFRSIADFGIN